MKIIFILFLVAAIILAILRTAQINVYEGIAIHRASSVLIPVFLWLFVGFGFYHIYKKW